MKTCAKALLIGYLLIAASGRAAKAEIGLFQAVRNNDLSRLKSAASDRANVNVRGARDVTPLMHAAAFGSVEAVEILLASGADVNAKDAFGATALLWAAGDPRKAQILVEHGADVNATTTRGRTPLIFAASHDGNIETVRLLLAKGADVSARDMQGSTALMTAANAGALDTVKLLIDYGAKANEADLAGFTPLHHAAGNGDREMMRLLLSKGAEVNAANTFGGEVKFGQIALKKLTPLMMAAPHGTPEVIGVLLKAGAEVDARDSRGMRPLMFAVASETQGVRVVRQLLEAGADVNSRNDAGESVLDWARKYGNRKVIATLEKAGAEGGAVVGAVASGESADNGPYSPREAVERSVALLQKASGEFFRQSGCVGCHHQPMTLMAVSQARKAGLAVDESGAREAMSAILASWDMVQPALLEGIEGPAPPDIQVSSVFGLAAGKQPASLVTDTLAANIAARQRRDGSWKLTGFSRAPMEESHFARTAMSLRALQLYGTPGLKATLDEQILRARRWLENSKPRTTDDLVWRLAGLYWSGSETGKVVSAATALRKMQRADGGWGARKNRASDVFATATALWALHATGAISPLDDSYQRGVDFLLRTQKRDGSWHVNSRAPKFQPYFESGFPHGHDQWISAAATAWAAMALAPAADRAVSQLSPGDENAGPVPASPSSRGSAND